MERKDKIAWLAFIGLMLVGSGYLMYISQPYEETVWVPPNATIANFVNGAAFVNLVDIQISGTAVGVKSLSEYKDQISDRGDVAVYIIKPPGGGAGFEINYITKTKDKTYYYQDRQVYVGLLGDYTFSVQAGLLKAHYTRNIWAVMLDTIVLFFAGLLLTRPNPESLKNLRGKKI